jgi:hypothetical protein
MAAITDLSTVLGSTLTGADFFVVNDSGTDKKLSAGDVMLADVANVMTVPLFVNSPGGSTGAAEEAGNAYANTGIYFYYGGHQYALVVTVKSPPEITVNNFVVSSLRIVRTT